MGNSVNESVRRWFKRLYAASLVGLILSGVMSDFIAESARSYAEGETAQILYQMALDGQGEAAVLAVVEAAAERGGWAPAPGDTVVYDPTMASNVRGAVLVVDTPPAECSDPKLRRLTDGCDRDFQEKQNFVRFGRAIFSTPMGDGDSVPREAFDDLLATYIEEVGHSWQEYLFETQGQGSGERTRPTTWEDNLYWHPGWEYQVKMYIFNLDGGLLQLSPSEHERLRHDICDANGYANPTGKHVASFGAPAGWPNPQGWPVAAPTPEQFQAFCAG